MASLMGLAKTYPPWNPNYWGDTVLTAVDTVKIYKYILTALDASDRELVLDALRGASRIAADQFDQFFGIPSGLPVQPFAIKQGWMMTSTETVLNTTGLVGTGLRYAVAVLASFPLGTSYSAGINAINAAVAKLADLLAPV